MNRSAVFYSLAAAGVIMALMVGDYGTLVICLVFALLWKRA